MSFPSLLFLSTAEKWSASVLTRVWHRDRQKEEENVEKWSLTGRDAYVSRRKEGMGLYCSNAGVSLEEMPTTHIMAKLHFITFEHRRLLHNSQRLRGLDIPSLPSSANQKHRKSCPHGLCLWEISCSLVHLAACDDSINLQCFNLRENDY